MKKRKAIAVKCSQKKEVRLGSEIDQTFALQQSGDEG